MVGNKMLPSQLQRRGGRRVSIPSSPTFLEKRSNDRVGRSDIALSPADTLVTGGPGSRSADLHTSSYNQEVPGIMNYDIGPYSERPQTDVTEVLERRIPSVEDHGWSPHAVASTPDPAYGHSPRPAQFDLALRGTSFAGGVRENSIGRLFDTKERQVERPSHAGRNISTPSLSASERSINEEVPLPKAPIAKKSRLNLLNPMSLLARRRSSQNAKLEDVNLSPLHVPAIPDFDPSIRGKFVHDFSAPRIRTPRRDTAPSPAQCRPPDHANAPAIQNAPPALYSPAFKEHFQDETALQPSQTAYLHNQPLEAPSSDSLPAFAQKLPTRLPSHSETVHHIVTSNDVGVEQPKAPPVLPPSLEKTPSPVYDAMPTTLPKHWKSTSSRFSFQVSGQGSTAEEQLLEEKHRERYPEKPARLRDVDDFDENGYDDYDFDAEDGFEERIPGVNSDYDAYDDDSGALAVPITNIDLLASRMNDYEDDDGFDTDAVQVKNVNIPTSSAQYENGNASGIGQRPEPPSNFRSASQSLTFSPFSPHQASEPTPRDVEGFPIGIADTKYSPKVVQHRISSESQQPADQLGLYTDETQIHAPTASQPQNTFDDADLYFDDGEFDTEDIGLTSGFDENLLDDEEHIRDIPAENLRRYEAATRRDLGDGSADTSIPPTHTTFVDVPSTETIYDLPLGVVQSLTGDSMGTPATLGYPSSSGLTEGNLAAYHDALVMAANDAATNGRFNRQVSFSEKSDVVAGDVLSSSQAGLETEEDHFGTGMRYGDADGQAFQFDDDDCFDDDLMIAEANAEALENDDEGFYGQEFGFYARAYGRGQSDLINGGFFTSHGSNGIKRSHSGKAHFQEPSLTPITERSEWSARNSVASLPFHNGVPTSAQSLPSPGLSQLLDSPGIEDEMTLEALMKLRRGAFGGSSTSINSMGERNMPSSSPLAHLPSYKPSLHESSSSRPMTASHSAGGTTSIVESEEEDDYGDLPMLNQYTPQMVASEQTIRSHDLVSSQLKSEHSATNWRGHHSRNSSGAESVSYARDEDGRWILERRRTGDDGELELIGREYLAGARI